MTAAQSPSPVDRPVDHPWATRAELLAASAEAVPALERRLLSVRRVARQTALTLVFLFLGGSSARPWTSTTSSRWCWSSSRPPDWPAWRRASR